MGAEINYDEVFGVSTGAQSSDAGSGAEAAAKGGDAGGEGEKAQAQAAAQSHSDADADEDGQEGKGEEGQSEGEKQELTPEDRAKNAARRRKAEVKEAADRARQEAKDEAKKEWDNFFASAGLKNPLDGNKPITNLEEYQAYKAKFDAAQLEKNLKAGKLTQEDLNKVIEQAPAMQKAQKLLSKAETEENAAKEAAAQAKIKDEIGKIAADFDPAIKTVQDLLHMERSKEFYDYVRKGNSFYDAYKLAYFDKITQTKQTAAQQQALNLANSKAHLTATAARGAGAITVPADEMALYRQMLPGATDAEIQKHYNAYKKK